MQLYQENQMQATENTSHAIKAILEKAPHKTLSLDQVISELDIPRTSIHVREVIWKMLDRNELRLTPERNLKLIDCEKDKS